MSALPRTVVQDGSTYHTSRLINLNLDVDAGLIDLTYELTGDNGTPPKRYKLEVRPGTVAKQWLDSVTVDVVADAAALPSILAALDAGGTSLAPVLDPHFP
jgi:hypothetical protein